MLETWLRRRGRGGRDLHALIVISFTALGHRALGAGGAGVRFATWVVVAILIVLLLASLEQGQWFRREPPRRRRDSRDGGR